MEEEYSRFAEEQEKAFESICRRCGECCGSFDDPCSDLIKRSGGDYVCGVYSDRLGEHKTVSGKVFTCVSIREHIKMGTLRPKCSYRRPSRAY